MTNPTPDGNTHPQFNVGGHMTPDPEGYVAYGADSYLMPLCSWHNQKNRDGVDFKLRNSLVLRLSGYMMGEVAASFTARLPAKERFAIINTDDDEIKSINLSDKDEKNVEKGRLRESGLRYDPEKFVLIERIHQDTDYRYFLRDTEL